MKPIDLTSSMLQQPARRRLLAGLGLVGAGGALVSALPAAAQSSICASAATLFADGFETASASVATPASCVLIPSETAGPYPLYSVLQTTGIVRSDIAEGRPGVPLTLALQLVDIDDGCAPIEGASIYLWHCDKDGAYSGYSQPGANTQGEIFCRGVQSTDCTGLAVFRTMYPGWYEGRITHIHFQVYFDQLGTLTATSQLAFPPAITQAVYASSLYAARGQNSSVPTFAQDNVFSDGVSQQLAAVTGDVGSGYTAQLVIGVSR